MAGAISVRYRFGLRLRKREALLAENISGGGVKLHLTEKLKAGTHLSIEIMLSGEKEHLPAKGVVAWSMEAERKNQPRKICYEAGIRFTNIDPLSIYKIYNYFSGHNLEIKLL